jgi:hypothetical protein
MLTLRSDAPAFQFYILGPVIEDTTVKLKWTDDTIARITLDSRAATTFVTDPLFPDEPQPSLVSGTVRAAGPAGTTEITATLYAHITDPDAALATVTDTLTVVEPGEGVPESSGTFFGGAFKLVVKAPGLETLQFSNV